MSRFGKRTWVDERLTASLEQLQIWQDEQVAYWAARRAKGEDIDSIPVKSRTLSDWERRFLELLEERRETEKNLAESGW